MYTPQLFDYSRRFAQVWKKGLSAYPGEVYMKFGHLSGEISAKLPAENETIEFGAVVVLDSDGKARNVIATDTAFDGIAQRNVTGALGVKQSQIYQYFPDMTISLFRGNRGAEIAVPFQNNQNTLLSAGTKTAPVEGGKVYIRVKEHGEEAPDWSNDSVDYKIGAIVKHSDVLYTVIKDHTSANNDASTPGHADSADKFVAGVANFPIGGIESFDNDETVEWTGATFATGIFYPTEAEKLTDLDGLTTACVGIKVEV